MSEMRLRIEVLFAAVFERRFLRSCAQPVGEVGEGVVATGFEAVVDG